MNTVKLNDFHVRISNPYIQNNEVFVYFEYEKLSEKEVKIYLSGYIGESEENYRFHFKIIYVIEFSFYLKDEKTLVESSIDAIIEPLMNIIMIIDQMIKIPKERLN